MRIIRNSYAIAKIAGCAAGLRTLTKGLKRALAARLDEISALALLVRAKLLKGAK